jgi:hypothetical protein
LKPCHDLTGVLPWHLTIVYVVYCTVGMNPVCLCCWGGLPYW